jgi:hypothetical protein
MTNRNVVLAFSFVMLVIVGVTLLVLLAFL